MESGAAGALKMLPHYCAQHGRLDGRFRIGLYAGRQLCGRHLSAALRRDLRAVRRENGLAPRGRFPAWYDRSGR